MEPYSSFAISRFESCDVLMGDESGIRISATNDNQMVGSSLKQQPPATYTLMI